MSTLIGASVEVAEAREQLENPDIGMLSTVRVGPWKPGG